MRRRDAGLLPTFSFGLVPILDALCGDEWRNGRGEQGNHHHSWNTPPRYTNWLLFKLQRHSDHHETACRRYQAPRHREDSPQLPAGYAAMLVLALLPSLWRRVMDDRAFAAVHRTATLLQPDDRYLPMQNEPKIAPSRSSLL